MEGMNSILDVQNTAERERVYQVFFYWQAIFRSRSGALQRTRGGKEAGDCSGVFWSAWREIQVWILFYKRDLARIQSPRN